MEWMEGCGRGFPIEQNQLIEGPNAFAPAGSMATGIPAPSLVPIPENGILLADGALLTQEFTNVDARTASQGAAALVERGLPADPARSLHGRSGLRR